MHVSLIQVPRLPPAAPEHQMTLSNTKLKRWLSALWKDNMSQVTALACSHSCCHLYLNFHLNSKFTCFHCNNNNTYSCECSSHAYRVAAKLSYCVVLYIVLTWDSFPVSLYYLWLCNDNKDLSYLIKVTCVGKYLPASPCFLFILPEVMNVISIS